MVLRDGFPVVFTVDAANVAHLVRIEPGGRDAGFVEVRGGLAPGAQVVAQGAGFLADGDKVRIVSPSPAPATAAATP